MDDPSNPLAGGATFELASATAAVRVLDSANRHVPDLAVDVTGAELELYSERGQLIAGGLEIALSDVVIPEHLDRAVPMHLTDVSLALTGADPIALELRWSLVDSDGQLNPLAPQPLASGRLDLGFDADAFVATAELAIDGEVLDFGELAIHDLSVSLILKERAEPRPAPPISTSA